MAKRLNVEGFPKTPGADQKHGWIGTETVKTRVGNFKFKNGYPTPEAANALLEQLTFSSISVGSWMDLRESFLTSWKPPDTSVRLLQESSLRIPSSARTHQGLRF